MFTCPAVDGGIPKEPMLREADSNGAGDEIPSETYADVLSQHLRSLQVVLLQHHATELGRLRDQNDKLQRQLASAQTRLRGVDEDPQPRVISMPALPGYPALEREESAASGQVSKLVSNSSLAVDIATSDLKQCERWQTLTAKLIEAAGCMTAFDAPAPKPRSTAGIMCELKMRPSWSHSLVQTKATYQRSRSHIAALREMSSTFKINDAFTDTSFLQRFVVGPHSRHQLVWAIIASVFIIWDLITIPLEMFNVAEFIRVLDIVGVTSLTFWVSKAESSAAMGDDGDVRLTTVSKDGEKLGNLIPAGSMTAAEGKSAIPGKWKIPGVQAPVELKVSGSSVKSVQEPFGNQPFLGEIEEGEKMLGLHVTLGGFPMKAWMKKEGQQTVLTFSNGGRWSKL
ncbi:hypothetical protein AK812_SmicGene43455 [Symbiodinium microadriaticum]|uniref:Uncharacterized protein n=1 Tax=Symbiodinium microadriaticum TaxID=2951 RepID=A0A1Q9C0Z1_SYMMI|nr:hypothetical protein AK812_SmicGene43455 [Symbiodinium microadriaticum]